ncbi:GlcG/HbpS family heme-binding protein [Helicobacter cappadocius]|uniref:Heme-binding protein n=1 Tax=Helicobacter cappadocius TaxID=3063998 RepID=A0AA90PPM5_9HELI|nr:MULTISPECIES: heme-binding protein [unclassified Helicobacter]MDO7252494.1 heme-binding protein [Helicobacter sp. faydin-H75]MDP2538361.1 heme-binding protein [Helicobacter sp. faydin-H76]
MNSKFLFLALVFGASFAQALPKEPILTTEVALKMAQSTFDKCKTQGYSVSVNVLDRGGNQIAFLKDENAGVHTIEGSYKKAFTALSTKTPSSKLAEKMMKKQIPEGMVNLSKNFVFLAGGIPIKVDNVVIGSVGVSGAPVGEIDEKCAQAGIESIQKELK